MLEKSLYYINIFIAFFGTLTFSVHRKDTHMEQQYTNCFELVKEKERYIQNQLKETRYFNNKCSELESTINKYCRLVHKSKTAAEDDSTTKTKNNTTFDAMTAEEYTKINKLLSFFRTYQPFYYAEKMKVYYLSPSGNPDYPYMLDIITPEALFNQFFIPYIDCCEANTLYASIYTLIKHYRTKVIKSFKEESKQLKEPINDFQFKSYAYADLHIHYLFKYLLSSNLPAFPYWVPLPLLVANYYVLQNGNLCYTEFEGANPCILTKEGIINIFKTFEARKLNEYCIANPTNVSEIQKFFEIPKPSENKNIKNLFDCIKKLCNPATLEENQISEDKNIIFTNANIEQYCFHYVQRDSTMNLEPMNEIQKQVIAVPINTTIKPLLTDSLISYLGQLVGNDLDSLRTLGKLTAATFSYQQPLQHLILTESDTIGLFNLLIFLNHIAPTIEQPIDLNHLLKHKNALNFLIESNNNPSTPLIMLTYGRNIAKNGNTERSQLIKLISGASITFKDPYVSEIRLRNNSPIVFAAESMNDYQFLSKYHHMCMNLYCDNLLNYEPSKEEREWLTQIFLPWSKEILCNSNLDITKKQKKGRQNFSKNSIEKFLNLFVRKKSGANIYPDTLYNAYLKYFSSNNTNTHAITKGAFIKQIKTLEGYDYRQYHIRHTATHKGSNKYAFRNIELDETALNNYIEKNEIPIQDTYNIKEDLELITEHYKNLFDTVISPGTNEKIKMQHQPNARIVRASPTEQPKPFEKIQKVTKTIKR